MINYLNSSVIPGIEVGKNKPHHGKLIFVTVAFLILAWAGIFYAFYYSADKTQIVPQNLTAEEMKLAQLKADMNNPTAVLTAEQIKAKQDLLKLVNPTAKMTTSEEGAKQSQIQEETI